LQLKTKRKNGGENKARWVIMGVQCKRVSFFVTGEVFLLDIGLLMGAIVFNISIIYTSIRRYYNFEE
jgi:hypothetical protein